MNRKLIISLMLGAAISTGGLYLAFKNIPFVELWGYLVTINYFWLLPAAACRIRLRRFTTKPV